MATIRREQDANSAQKFLPGASGLFYFMWVFVALLSFQFVLSVPLSLWQVATHFQNLEDDKVPKVCADSEKREEKGNIHMLPGEG